MRVRHLILRRKTITTDTDWRDDALPPRFSGIYPKTRPAKPDWKWRSAQAHCSQHDYILLCEINEMKDNWRAWLIRKSDDEGSLVARYEFHGSHPGLHLHADCERGGVEVGPTSIKVPLRIPAVGSERTRPPPTRPSLFWETARRYFRMDYAKGSLL
jgi:hypothetical protein